MSLVLDLVLNHVAREHDWAVRARDRRCSPWPEPHSRPASPAAARTWAPPPDPVRLTVDGAGSGSGMVATTVGPEPSLKCTIVQGNADAASCSVIYAVGTSVTLSAIRPRGAS